MNSTRRLQKLATAAVVASFITMTQFACASAETITAPHPTETGFYMVADAPASTIEGRVTIRPVRSVERRGATNSEPYQATITVFNSSGREVANVQSDIEGRFRLQVSPGTYVLRPQSPGMYPRASEQNVLVKRNSVTQVEIAFDSGRR